MEKELKRIALPFKIKVQKQLRSRLTTKELYVVVAMFDGMIDTEIAKSLDNSVRTIEKYKTVIYKKMQVRGALELVVTILKNQTFKYL